MSIDDFDRTGSDEDELFERLHRSLAGASLTTSAADVVALGRRSRNRHRALAVGIGTSAAAVVAAIGVLGPSAGIGSGSAPHNTAQGANTTRGAGTTDASGGAQTLDIQEAGFTLEAKGDGTVQLSMREVFDPDKLQAALARVGIPADIRRVTLPARPDGYLECAPTPGVTADTRAVGAMTKLPGSDNDAEPTLVFRPAALPAGDVVALTMFVGADGKPHYSQLSIMTGRSGPCHLVPNTTLLPKQ